MSAVVDCPSCGQPVPMPDVAKKTGLWWGIGCLIAIPALMTVIAIIGLLAAIAIPSFVNARNTARMNACINNMRIIESAKQQWALAENARDGERVNPDGVSTYMMNGTIPSCPAGGAYTFHILGTDPECSLHGSLSNPHKSTGTHESEW